MKSNLANVLKAFLALYERLLALAEQKNQALQKIDVQVIKKILAEEQTLIKEINLLEEKRRQFASNIEEERAGEDIKSLRRALGDVIEKVCSISQRNDRLTRQTLELIGYKINILNETSVGTTYAAEGLESVCEKKYLDFKA